MKNSRLSKYSPPKFSHLLTTLAMCIFLSATTASAATSCKGKTQNACSSDSACSWIKGFSKKDGKKVSAYCRAKPKKKKNLAPKQKSASVDKAKGAVKKTAENKKTDAKKAIKKATN